jgi:hypothetical protein
MAMFPPLSIYSGKDASLEKAPNLSAGAFAAGIFKG